jgi:hypothetical protein
MTAKILWTLSIYESPAALYDVKHWEERFKEHISKQIIEDEEKKRTYLLPKGPDTIEMVTCIPSYLFGSNPGDHLYPYYANNRVVKYLDIQALCQNIPWTIAGTRIEFNKLLLFGRFIRCQLNNIDTFMTDVVYDYNNRSLDY